MSHFDFKVKRTQIRFRLWRAICRWGVIALPHRLSWIYGALLIREGSEGEGKGLLGRVRLRLRLWEGMEEEGPGG